jgi:hypothetical protein
MTKFTPTHRHIKRGSSYMLTGAVTVQCAAPVSDGDILMLYEAEDGRLYVRPRHEFYDGRFEKLDNRWKDEDRV